MLRVSKRDRVMAAVCGRETDRVPVGFWYHFPLDHPSGAPLAEAELAFAKKFDPDFLKVMHDLPVLSESIDDPADWSRVRPISPESGGFAEQIEALHLIRKGLVADMPVIDTVFNPLASANKLCGKRLLEHLRSDPTAVRHGLQAIAVSLADYASAWVREGGDGIYYALDTDLASEEEYREIFLPLDRLILETAMEAGCLNVLHLHGTNIMFDLLHDLPCHVLQWSSRTTPPSLSAARGMHSGCIAGGVNELTIAERGPADVMNEVRSAVAEAGSVGFIVTPGCAVPTETPEENLFAIRQVVEP
ncbi:MAG: uroporphyrinogen decarboxylase family protein [Armatimonadota bacterium]